MIAKRVFSVEDVRALLRLCNELYELPPDCDCREQRLLEALCRLVGAKTGILVTAQLEQSQPKLAPLAVVHGEEGAEDQASLHRYLQTTNPPDPISPMLAARLARHWLPITRTRRQWMGDKRWYASDHVQQVRRPMGLDDCLHSAHPIPETKLVKWVILSRRWGAKQPFTPRHAMLVHLVHSQLDWFYRAERPADILHMPGLTPRLRQTLQHLLAGDGEKQVAAKIGCSPHTVHVYVKALYRFFGVSSRAELLARWLRR